MQGGADHEGIGGFLQPDILRELKRASRLVRADFSVYFFRRGLVGYLTLYVVCESEHLFLFLAGSPFRLCIW